MTLYMKRILRMLHTSHENRKEIGAENATLHDFYLSKQRITSFSGE